MLSKYLKGCKIALWVHDIIAGHALCAGFSLQCAECYSIYLFWLHTHEKCMCTYRICVVVFECATEPCVCECLTHACPQDGLRPHRLPGGGRAEGGAGGREEEVQPQWAGEQTHLPHSAPQDVSPTKYPPLAYCSTSFCQQSQEACCKVGRDNHLAVTRFQ